MYNAKINSAAVLASSSGYLLSLDENMSTKNWCVKTTWFNRMVRLSVSPGFQYLCCVYFTYDYGINLLCNSWQGNESLFQGNYSSVFYSKYLSVSAGKIELYVFPRHLKVQWDLSEATKDWGESGNTSRCSRTNPNSFLLLEFDPGW